jgi:hypothetical protein
MSIKGLYADEAINRFAESQYVNVWDALTRGFFCEAQMNDLPAEVIDDPESYFLEPTTAEGAPVSLRSALALRNASRAGNTITISRREEAGCWVACYPEGARAPGREETVAELFGTSELPTAFTLAAPADAVRDEIRRLNPGYEVVCL